MAVMLADGRRDRWTDLADEIARRDKQIPIYHWLCRRLWGVALKRALRGGE